MTHDQSKESSSLLERAAASVGGMPLLDGKYYSSQTQDDTSQRHGVDTAL